MLADRGMPKAIGLAPAVVVAATKARRPWPSICVAGHVCAAVDGWRCFDTCVLPWRRAGDADLWQAGKCVAWGGWMGAAGVCWQAVQETNTGGVVKGVGVLLLVARGGAELERE